MFNKNGIPLNNRVIQPKFSNQLLIFFIGNHNSVIIIIQITNLHFFFDEKRKAD